MRCGSLAVLTWLTWYVLALAGALPAPWTAAHGPFYLSLLFGVSGASCNCQLVASRLTADCQLIFS